MSEQMPMTDRQDRAQLRAEIDTAVRRLVEASSHPLVRDDTTITVGQLPSLLRQLREAIGGHGESNGHGRGTHRAPADVGAIDIEEQIETEAAELRARLDTYLPLEARLRELVELARYLDTDALRLLRDRANAWVERINAHLNPPRRLHIAAACPACGKRTAMVRNPDTGESEQRAALQIDGVHGCRCLACGEAWPTTHLHHLANVIEQQLIEERRERAAQRVAADQLDQQVG